MKCCVAAQKKRDIFRSGSKMKAESAGDDADAYTIEKHLVNNVIMATGRIKTSIIASYNGGEIRAKSPPDFNPPPKTIEAIIRALEGNTKEVAKGINFGPDLPTYIPGKLAETFLISSDGKNGGCIAYKTKECVLILCFVTDPNSAYRLALESAEYLTTKGL